MILNNFSKLCSCLCQNPRRLQTHMNFTDSSGNSPSFYSDSAYVTPNDGGVALFRITNNGDGLNGTPTWYIFLGKGTTQPTPSDYNFETAIEGATYTTSNASFVQMNNKLIYSAVINNTGDSSFSFSEVALGNFYSRGTATGKTTTVLLTRDVISPVTIEPGKPKTITIVIDFASMATSVA